MDILDKIVNDKLKEVGYRKKVISVSHLEVSPLFERNTLSLKKNLEKSKSGIIAEHKRRSPSKSVINQDLNVQDVAIGYENARVCGMSVLTDTKYFGGSLDDLLIARASCDLPLLRKEFIIDPYQILEAKAYGADVILLIAAILTTDEIKLFSQVAKSLGLEVLLEVHNEKELQRSLISSIDMLGVNNRNLKTFEVNLTTSKQLSALIPDDFTKISESGISSVEAIKELQPFGYKGFLIGENFMKTENPGLHAAEFINDLEG
ncbi:MAG: indole-3-glycerol phosphate synthase TrpC [Bacteroidia bacterium]|nr:indole-3-glycerol phosphate synthase TrpC [Bacteroidia bacterium]NND26119.1 indole-3-glycerol phosphate synthase TrpC [Flavobacteriaceae bacterium]MBT8278313.1 indole-3-glycerol phosphate synthase TrpC [Bacteroidia bacterium]NNK60060.1 indole-3-glycerol phosphate synthase TrpC [Flavobacteriaceae bacterium]NNL34126.1 indole-3-glycerol phosphate synthase TrpC [Flavobacteriaceae bacterium]